MVGDWQQGTPIQRTLHLSDDPFDIENFHLNVTVHKEAFRKTSVR